MKVLTRDKGLRSVVGELVSENDEILVVLSMTTGKTETISKAIVASVRKDMSDKEVSSTVGLATFLAWKIRKVVPTVIPQGSIAKIDGPILYVTLGAGNQLRADQELIVYRGKEIIKDPVTGEELGQQRRRIAKIVVTEVQAKFSKAKLVGDLEVQFAVGDMVEPTVSSDSIAIFPLLNVAGEENVAGRTLAEELTTGLVNAKIPVVERTRLGTVLTELAIEQTALIDPATAQKVGKLMGAYAVVTGTVISKGMYAEAQVRLVEVETGRILVAATDRLTSGGIVGLGPSGSDTRGTISAPRTASFSQALVARNKIRGSWKYEKGHLISGLEEDGQSIFELPFESNAEYRLTAVIKREQGSDALQFFLPSGDNAFIVQLDGRDNGQHCSGISFIDGATHTSPQNPNGTRRNGTVFGGAEPVTIEISVTRNGVSISADGKEILSWTGAPNRLSNPELQNLGLSARRFYLKTHKTSYRVQSVHVATNK